MIKIIKLISIILMSINLTNFALAENSFFDEGKKRYNEKKYEEAKFLFQRSIVFNPKDSDFYDSKTGEYDEDDKYDFQQLQKNKLNVWNKLSNDWKKSQMIKKKSQSNKKKTTSGNTNRRVSNTDF